MKKIKFNLGCAEDIKISTDTDEWINIDLFPIAPGVIQANALELPFKDNVALEILASHFVEHLELIEIYVAFKEWHRVLHRDGKLIIIVPDMDIISSRWNSAPLEMKLGWWNGAIFGSHRGPFQTHKIGLNAAILSKILGDTDFYVDKISHNTTWDFWLEVVAGKL